MDCLEIVEISKCSISLNASISYFVSLLSDAKITTDLHEVLSNQQGIEFMLTTLMCCRNQNGAVYIIGNGGSAAIASHATIDFINMVKMRSSAMLDPAVTTCISNDYGYEHVYARQLTQFIRPEDVLIAISSSGRSQNILNAVQVAKKFGVKTITLSGFSEENPLRLVGDYNLWLNSKDYGQVEIGHAFILHYLTDRLRESLTVENV